MKDFVTFEIAKKLKEKGFREKCLAYYNDDSIEYNHESKMFDCELFMSHNSYDNIWHRYYIDAPTISQTLKWLRKEKKIHICIDFEEDMNWYYQIAIYGSKDIAADGYGYNGYEEAVLCGIEYVLDNLIWL